MPCGQVAEAALCDVRVEGSLLVTADAVMGHMEAPRAQQQQHFRSPSEIHVSHPDGTSQASPHPPSCTAASHHVSLLNKAA